MVLAVLMLVGMFPVSVFAADEDTVYTVIYRAERAIFPDFGREEVTIDGVTYGQNTHKLNQNNTLGVPSIQPEQGYAFTGWIDEEGNSPVAGATVEKNVVYTATYKPAWIVVFKADGVEVAQREIVYENRETPVFLTADSIPEAPNKVGYSLKGWAIEGGEETEEDLTACPISSDITFVADYDLLNAVGDSLNGQSYTLYVDESSQKRGLIALMGETKSNNKNRLDSVTIYPDNPIPAEKMITEWTFEHVEGNWYHIKADNGKYLRINTNKTLALDTANPQNIYVHIDSTGRLRLQDKDIEHFSQAYAVNLQGDNADNGFQSSKWSVDNLHLTAEDDFTAGEGFRTINLTWHTALTITETIIDNDRLLTAADRNGITFTVTGPQFPDGYSFTYADMTNGSVTFVDVAVGEYTVTQDAFVNGLSVTGDEPVTVAISNSDVNGLSKTVAFTNTYTGTPISFDANGGEGEVPSAIYGKVGADIVLPDYKGTKTREDGLHFIFRGWMENSDLIEGGKTYQVGEAYTISENGTTLYADWDDQAVVTFNSNNGLDAKWDPVWTEIGSTIELYVYENSLGYTFLGWSEIPNPSNANEVYGINEEGKILYTVPDRDVTLYAIWDHSVAVTFDPAGVQVDKDLEPIAGPKTLTIAELPGYDPIQEGMLFLGWSTTEPTEERPLTGEDVDYLAGDPLRTDVDLSLYAVWQELVKVVFEGNNGTVIDENGHEVITAGPDGFALYGMPGDYLILPDFTAIPNDSSKHFVGWSRETTYNNQGSRNYKTDIYEPGDSFQITKEDGKTGSVTLHAFWSSNMGAAQYGIRMDGTIPYEPGNYSTSLYSKTHVYHDAVGEQLQQSVVNKQAWVIDLNPGEPVEGEYYFENDVTRNLRYLPDEAEIEEIYPGFDFENQYIHWYVLKYLGGTYWHVDGVVLSRDKLNIVYDANAGNITVENMPYGYQVNYGEEIYVGRGIKDRAAKEPRRSDGWVFAGWSLNTRNVTPESGYSNDDVVKIKSNVVFYAQWEREDENTSSLKIEKTNKFGETLYDAEFELTRQNARGKFLSVASGRIASQELDVALDYDVMYCLKETKAPDGYILRDTPVYFKVVTTSENNHELRIYDEYGQITSYSDWLKPSFANNTVVLTVKDESKTHDVTIKKGDENGAYLNDLRGARFTVYRELNGGTLKAITSVRITGENGRTVTLPYGTYRLVEIDVPGGYEIIPDQDGNMFVRFELGENTNGIPEIKLLNGVANKENFTITVKNRPYVQEEEKVSVGVKKVWNDDNDRDVVRPSAITVNLIAPDREIVAATTLSSANATTQDGNTWEGSFTDLPKYDASQNEIDYSKYSVEENEIPGYTLNQHSWNANDELFVLVNTHEPETVRFNGQKIWVDEDDKDHLRPDSIAIVLSAVNATMAQQEQKIGIKEDGTYNWKYSFEAPKYAKNNNGDRISIAYEVTENISDEVKNNYPVRTISEADGENGITVDFTNKHIVVPVTVTVKKVWNDTFSQHPEVTVQLLANGKEVEGKTLLLNEADGWTGAFSELPRYDDNGKTITYTVKETVGQHEHPGQFLPEYKYSDYTATITNTYSEYPSYTIHYYLNGTDVPIAEDRTGFFPENEVLDVVDHEATAGSITEKPVLKEAFEPVEPITGAQITGFKEGNSSVMITKDGSNVITVYYAVPLIIIAGSSERAYNGKPLTDNTFEIDSSTPLVNGDQKDDFSVTMTAESTRTDAGTKKNEISSITYPEYYYLLPTQTGTLKVTQQLITVNDTDSREYNGKDQTLTITADKASGVVPGETLTLTGAEITGKAVGSYETVSAYTWSVAKQDGSDSTGNYTIKVTGTLTITKPKTIPITVKAENKSKTYGTTDPELTWIVLDSEGNEISDFDLSVLKVNISRTEGEDVGTYTITPSGDEVQGNYTVSYDTGTFTITPAALTVTVTGNTATKTYNGSEQNVTGYEISIPEGATLTAAEISGP
ncbi:MAG: Cna B-type domain-containing protein, partial [Oscillospiraceae bacterium]|nr:Cna B-type domain-containing protein [Oscillospiraceae bacterium]